MNTPVDDLRLDISNLQKEISLARTLAKEARENLIKSSSILTSAIQSRGGQGRKVEDLLWSVWGGQCKVDLCDTLSALDSSVSEAVIHLLAARTHCGGDVDDLLRDIN
ncbi:MAG: hypothetical protein ACK5NG_07120 [Chthoniobacterales bacterium]